jgi:hypothetical protein
MKREYTDQKPTPSLIPSTVKLAAFFALLNKRQRDHEAQKAQERKDNEDKKLAKLRPWWQDFAQ